MAKSKSVIEEKSINDVNFEALKRLFPHAVSVDEDGRYVIDPQKLQMSLDPAKAYIREDGYGLNWVGKKEAYHAAFAKNYKVLKPLNDDNSKHWDTTENILIKGDNLDALKILRHNYFESIKMIYIDPPYNTKNDGFVYNDNFTSNTEETLEELGYEKEYIDYIENIQGAKTHSGWLSFMYPRLLLAKDLLKEDGVIFISIDDNEVAQLRLLCDEVFGGDNFVGEFIWKSRASEDNRHKTGVSGDHEYILTYSKNQDIRLIGVEKDLSKFTNPDNDKRGKWRSADITGLVPKALRPNCDYDLINPITGINYGSSPKGWRYEKSTMQKLIDEHRILWPENRDGRPRRKLFLNEINDLYKNISTLITSTNTSVGTKEINNLLGLNVFDFPKPVNLISKLIKQVGKDSLILDFFAGSGTTAHAVMDLNAQDGGNRKFIAVQWAEETPEKSEARKAGYETVFDITQERIKRAGEQIVKDDLTTQELDIGFRTFEVVEDINQKIYQKPIEEMTQEDLTAFTQKSVESSEEILYNLLVAESLPLSTKIETLIEDKLYLADNVAFVLGDVSIDDFIASLKERRELEYVCVYSPNISNDKFTLELESAVVSVGVKPDNLRFRG